MNQFSSGKPIVALGLMSGTSLDGIDAALIETDGKHVVDVGPAHTSPYPQEFRERLKSAVELAANTDQPTSDVDLISDLTSLHIDCIHELMRNSDAQKKWARPELIGFHGHTTLHRPAQGVTQQVGNPSQLANAFSVPVVSNFRVLDVEAGGQGAPLAPIYHAALLRPETKPVCMVNIGGISNITWVGGTDNELVAFDTGPGNGLLDAWTERTLGQRYDEGGQLAASGSIDNDALQSLLSHPYFSDNYPKSLDRSDLSFDYVKSLSPADGAATLLAFTVKTILLGLDLCPKLPTTLYVTGGGRHNTALMASLQSESVCDIRAIEDLGWNGDALEAQAFAYMAMRSVMGLPITFSGTTGVQHALSGGVLTPPST